MEAVGRVVSLAAKAAMARRDFEASIRLIQLESPPVELSVEQRWAALAVQGVFGVNRGTVILDEAAAVAQLVRPVRREQAGRRDPTVKTVGLSL